MLSPHKIWFDGSSTDIIFHTKFNLKRHILLTFHRTATNGGRIRPTITVFRQTKPNGEHVRMWNQRLVSFAGFKTLNGTVSSLCIMDILLECGKETRV